MEMYDSLPVPLINEVEGVKNGGATERTVSPGEIFISIGVSCRIIHILRDARNAHSPGRAVVARYGTAGFPEQ